MITVTNMELLNAQGAFRSYLTLTEKETFDKKSNNHLTYWIIRCINSTKSLLKDLGQAQDNLSQAYKIPNGTRLDNLDKVLSPNQAKKFLEERDKLLAEKVEINLFPKKISEFINLLSGQAILELEPFLVDDMKDMEKIENKPKNEVKKE